MKLADSLLLRIIVYKYYMFSKTDKSCVVVINKDHMRFHGAVPIVGSIPLMIKSSVVTPIDGRSSMTGVVNTQIRCNTDFRRGGE